MRKLRYTLYSPETRAYLMAVERPLEGTDAAVTRWTRRPDSAMRFPGVKSARAMAESLDGRIVILNGRGERL